MYKATYAEHATILAALRYFQRSTKEKTRASVVPEIFDGVDPLTDSEIDALCERINTQDVML